MLMLASNGCSGLNVQTGTYSGRNATTGNNSYCAAGQTKLGVGTLTYGTLTNTYSGPTLINNGILSVGIAVAGNILALNSTAVTIQGTLLAPATLQFTAATNGTLTNNNVTLSTADGGNIIDVPTAAGDLNTAIGVKITSPAGTTNTGQIALIKTGLGTLGFISGGGIYTVNNDYAGNTQIRNGTIRSNTNAGSVGNQFCGPVGNTIFLGDTGGSNNATFAVGGNLLTFVGNPIVVVAGNTGTSKFSLTNGTTPTLSIPSSFTLNKDLTIQPLGNAGAGITNTFSGKFTGVGNLTIANSNGAFTTNFNFTNTTSDLPGNISVTTGGTASSRRNFGVGNNLTSRAELQFDARCGDEFEFYRHFQRQFRFAVRGRRRDRRRHDRDTDTGQLAEQQCDYQRSDFREHQTGQDWYQHPDLQRQQHFERPSQSAAEASSSTALKRPRACIPLIAAFWAESVRRPAASRAAGGGSISPGAVASPGTFKSAGLALTANPGGSDKRFRLNGASNASGTARGRSAATTTTI